LQYLFSSAENKLLSYGVGLTEFVKFKWA